MDAELIITADAFEAAALPGRLQNHVPRSEL